MIAEKQNRKPSLLERATKIFAQSKESILADRAVAVLLKCRNSDTLTEEQKAEIKKQNEARAAAKTIYQQAAIAAAAKIDADKKKKREDQAAEILLLLLLAGEDAYSKTYFVLGTVGLKSSDATQLEEQAKTFAQSRQKDLKGYAEKLADAVEKTKAELKKEVPNEITAARSIRETAKKVSETMTDTESQITLGSVQIDRLKRAGFKTKIWATMEDEKVRPSHVECEEQGAIKIDTLFSNGLMYPGDENGDIKEIANCRCWLLGGTR